MRLNRRRQLRLGRVMVGLLSSVGVVGFLVGLSWATNLFGWRQWRLAEVQQFIGAEVPAGAGNVQFITENQKTRIVWLRFILPAEADLSDFLNRMGLKPDLREGFTPFPAQNPAEAEITWWTPQAAQSYSGLYAIHAGKVYELLLDETDAAPPAVYLRVYAIGMENG